MPGCVLDIVACGGPSVAYAPAQLPTQTTSARSGAANQRVPYSVSRRGITSGASVAIRSETTAIHARFTRSCSGQKRER